MTLGLCSGCGLSLLQNEAGQPEQCDKCLGVAPVVLMGDALAEFEAAEAAKAAEAAAKEAAELEEFRKWKASKAKGK